MLGQCLNQSDNAGKRKAKQVSSTELEKAISPVKRRSSSRNNVSIIREPSEAVKSSVTSSAESSSVFSSASEEETEVTAQPIETKRQTRTKRQTNPKRQTRQGKVPEKTVIEETESEDDQHEPQNPRRGLRGTQSTSSIVSTLSSTTTRTRSRSSQNSINANSSQGMDAFLSPQAKGKASQLQESLGRVTRSTSKEIVQTNSKPVGRRRKIL